MSQVSKSQSDGLGLSHQKRPSPPRRPLPASAKKPGMTEISLFISTLQDKLLYMPAGLLRKAYASGAQVAVTAEPDVLSVSLIELLWSFLCHRVRAALPDAIPESGPACQQMSMCCCMESHCRLPPSRCFGQSWPAGIPVEFERFERFIEVVTQGNVDERLPPREVRWKHYCGIGGICHTNDMTIMSVVWGRADEAASPPRFVPTLTEVVQPVRAARINPRCHLRCRQLIYVSPWIDG